MKAYNFTINMRVLLWRTIHLVIAEVDSHCSSLLSSLCLLMILLSLMETRVWLLQMQAKAATPPTIGGGGSPLPWWLAEALRAKRLVLR